MLLASAVYECPEGSGAGRSACSTTSVARLHGIACVSLLARRSTHQSFQTLIKNQTQIFRNFLKGFKAYNFNSPLNWLNLDLKPVLKLKTGFQTGLKSENWISNRFEIWKLVFKPVWNLKTGFETGFETVNWISNRFEIWKLDFKPVLKLKTG